MADSPAQQHAPSEGLMTMAALRTSGRPGGPLHAVLLLEHHGRLLVLVDAWPVWGGERGPFVNTNPFPRPCGHLPVRPI